MEYNYERPFVGMLKARLLQNKPFIQVVVGPRQVGKTTGLKQLIACWDGPSLMVSADEVLTADDEWLHIQWQRALQLGHGVVLVIDEIQKVSDWSRVIKVLYDRHRDAGDIRVVVLGSASLQIQKGLSESLVGRYERIVVGHWSYQEMSAAFGWNLTDYIRLGGYPSGVHFKTEFKRWQAFMVNSIISPVLDRDLLQIVRVNKPALFRQCFELAMSYPAQEISYQKLLGQLQESGNVSTIKHYLELFEGAFLMKSLQKYSRSTQRVRQSSPKILPLTTALPQALIGEDDVFENGAFYGRLFEVVVGSYLAGLPGELFYWRDGDKEVDFVLETSQDLFAIEVKSHGGESYEGIKAFQKLYPEAKPVLINAYTIDSLLTGQIFGALS